MLQAFGVNHSLTYKRKRKRVCHYFTLTSAAKLLSANCNTIDKRFPPSLNREEMIANYRYSFYPSLLLALSKSSLSSSLFCNSLYKRYFCVHFENTIHCLMPTPSHTRKTVPPMIGINIPTPTVVCDIKPIYSIIGTTMINERTIMITIFLLKSSW